jgi:hypothetical protein
MLDLQIERIIRGKIINEGSKRSRKEAFMPILLCMEEEA